MARPHSHHKPLFTGLSRHADKGRVYFILGDGRPTVDPQRALAEAQRTGKRVRTVPRFIVRRYTGEDLRSVVIDCEYGAPYRPNWPMN
jgi:hypothetical protein